MALKRAGERLGEEYNLRQVEAGKDLNRNKRKGAMTN